MIRRAEIEDAGLVAALDRVLEYIGTKPFGSSDRVTLTCNKENVGAIRLYKCKGFAETGVEDDGEIELSLMLAYD